MDNNTIKQHLQDIAQEEIPDVDLLPAIQKQLQKPQTSRPSYVMTVARLAAVFVIFVLAGAGGYAFYQQAYTDPSIPQERITVIGETQTVDDVTVRLETVYVDAHRANVNISVEHPRSVNYGGVMYSTLETKDGTMSFPPSFGNGGGGGGGGNADPDALAVSSLTSNFTMTVMEDMPEELDLTFTILLGTNPNMPPMGVPPAGSGGGGGGGGGGNAPEGQPTPMPPAEVPEREYSFDFTVSVIPALEIEPVSDTATDSDVTMTISDVRYTPSTTNFTLCYEMPEGGDWFPDIRIETASENSPFTAGRSGRPEVNDAGLTCQFVEAPAAVSDDTEAITIRVIQLFQPIKDITPELVEENEAFFAERGFDVQIDFNEEQGFVMGSSIGNIPNDMTRQEAWQFVNSNMFVEQYEGEWVFELPLE